jgi:hypothetical protein
MSERKPCHHDAISSTPAYPLHCATAMPSIALPRRAGYGNSTIYTFTAPLTPSLPRSFSTPDPLTPSPLLPCRLSRCAARPRCAAPA